MSNPIGGTSGEKRVDNEEYDGMPQSKKPKVPGLMSSMEKKIVEELTQKIIDMGIEMEGMKCTIRDLKLEVDLLKESPLSLPTADYQGPHVLVTRLTVDATQPAPEASNAGYSYVVFCSKKTTVNVGQTVEIPIDLKMAIPEGLVVILSHHLISFVDSLATTIAPRCIPVGQKFGSDVTDEGIHITVTNPYNEDLTVDAGDPVALITAVRV